MIRYTPFLDKLGIKIKDDVPDHAATIIDSALAAFEGMIDWGEDVLGRSRKPCPEQPVLLAGAPLGTYHCPACGTMLMAGLPHLPPEGYEIEMGRDWPAGYHEDEE
jgi:hypothetical protein